MARRQKKALTQREVQCRKVARRKALRNFFNNCWGKLRLALIAVVALALAAAGGFEYWTGGISRTAGQVVRAGYQMSAGLGFSVQSMYMEGRSRTALAEVKEALAVKRGEPILSLDLSEIRERLEAIPTVKHAAIERALPSTLYVKLQERDPVAVWQHRGQLSLIDDEGSPMHDLALKDYRGLPLVLGEGAPKHISEALAILVSEPALAPHVVAMVRVGDRRWNVRLQGDIEVKLPEKEAAAAWRRLAVLQQEQHLLERAVQSIDLRNRDRLYIRLAPSAIPPATPISARDT